MKLGLTLQASLQQTLTPQQIQYLKLLQLSTLQFEQHVQSQLENNPMLEELKDQNNNAPDSNAVAAPAPTADAARKDGAAENSSPQSSDASTTSDGDGANPEEGFDFYKLLWGEDPSNSKITDRAPSEDDDIGFQFRDVDTLEDDFFDQLRYLNLTPEQKLFAEYVIGNVDADGYLRRPMDELVAEVNATIAEHNLALQAPQLLGTRNTGFERDKIHGIDVALDSISTAEADRAVKVVQHLDPPGFASRTVQECLVAQLQAVRKPNAAQKLALLVLTDAYAAFTMKHYEAIERSLEVTEDYLREAIAVIRGLNPRPGGGTMGPEVNTLTPDFTVVRTDDGTDLDISVNDSRLPILKVSSAYDKLKREARQHKFNKETREYLRKKYEDAKFLIQALRQRKNTMLRVMTAIAGLQKEYFFKGPEALKPLIYRDVAEVTGLDISTICRIVNGKYVLTEFGTNELKYFFSESMETADGEEVSTRIIKQKLKELIAAESKNKPLSDDKLGQELKKVGYNIARRTVAKYREQLRIPVARLRKEL